MICGQIAFAFVRGPYTDALYGLKCHWPGPEVVRVWRGVGRPGARVRVEMLHGLVIGGGRTLPPPRERASEEGEEPRRGSGKSTFFYK